MKLHEQEYQHVDEPGQWEENVPEMYPGLFAFFSLTFLLFVLLGGIHGAVQNLLSQAPETGKVVQKTVKAPTELEVQKIKYEYQRKLAETVARINIENDRLKEQLMQEHEQLQKQLAGKKKAPVKLVKRDIASVTPVKPPVKVVKKVETVHIKKTQPVERKVPVKQHPIQTRRADKVWKDWEKVGSMLTGQLEKCGIKGIEVDPLNPIVTISFNDKPYGSDKKDLTFKLKKVMDRVVPVCSRVVLGPGVRETMNHISIETLTTHKGMEPFNNTLLSKLLANYIIKDQKRPYINKKLMVDLIKKSQEGNKMRLPAQSSGKRWLCWGQGCYKNIIKLRFNSK
jgi:gas vesicle protein